MNMHMEFLPQKIQTQMYSRWQIKPCLIDLSITSLTELHVTYTAIRKNSTDNWVNCAWYDSSSQTHISRSAPSYYWHW
jgi:hypothetical protein